MHIGRSSGAKLINAISYKHVAPLEPEMTKALDQHSEWIKAPEELRVYRIVHQMKKLRRTFRQSRKVYFQSGKTPFKEDIQTGILSTARTV
jgi:hypothetical protein